MTAKNEATGAARPVRVSTRGVALFACVWFGVMWLLIAALAAHAYRVGEATSFRYVGL